MIMPFIRLVSIYVIVIVAVVAVFKRDQIMEMTGWSFPGTEAQEVAQAEESETSDPAPIASVDTPAPSEAVTTAPVADAPASEPAETATAAPQPAPVQQAAADPAPAPGDTQERLNLARQSFWNGDLAGAEVLYAALARDEPTNPDVNGEHGNILYAQRRFPEAAEAYFATGKLLVETGNQAQAGQLLVVLQSLAPEKAAELHALMIN